MDEPTPNPEAIPKPESKPAAQNSGKDAWVTPVVREYDPAEVTKTTFSGDAAVDNVLYS